MAEQQKPLLIVSGGPALPSVSVELAEHFALISPSTAVVERARLRDIEVVPLAAKLSENGRHKAHNRGARLLVEMLTNSAALPGHPAGTQSWLPGFLNRRLTNLVLLLDALAAWQEERPIAGALLHNDVEPVTAGIALWCRGRGIPAIHLPHATHFDIWRADGAQGDIHSLIAASHLAAHSPYHAEWYEAAGFPAEKISITGNPAWDQWFERKPNRDRAIELLSLRKELPVILYASSWSQRTSLLGRHDGVVAGLRLMRKVGAPQWILKLHPQLKMDKGARQASVAAMRGSGVLIALDHLALCLEAADVLVALGPSNILIEGAICGVPGIALGGWPPGEETVVRSCGFDGEELRKALTSSVEAGWGSEANRERFLERYTAGPGAAQRVVDFVVEVCEDDAI